MRFAYKRRGGPLLDWSGPTAPYQSRAGETRSLGSLGDLNVPRPGAPEIVSGYESPQPGAAIVHLGGYMPEGAARGYGQTMIGADAPTPEKAPFDLGLVRKAAALAAGYHGVKRNNGSIFWGVIWAAAAFISPFHGVLVPLFGAAQGFGQARLKSNPARSKKRKSKKVWLPGAKVWARVGRPKKRKTKKNPARRTVVASPRARKEAARQRDLAKLWRKERPHWLRRKGKKFVVLNPSSRRRRR